MNAKLKLYLVEGFAYLLVFFLSYVRGHVGEYTSVPHYETLWAYDIVEGKLHSVSQVQEPHPIFPRQHYHFDGVFFYHDIHGRVLHYLELGPNKKLSPGREHYALYEKVGDVVGVFAKSGEKLWQHKTSAYPKMSPSGNRLLLLSSDATSISMLDINLNPILSNTFVSSLVTEAVFCDFDDSLALATIEGFVKKFSHNNLLAYSVAAPESASQVVKSIAVSEQGNYLAACSGLDPEYIFVLDKEGNLLWKVRTKENNTTPIDYLYVNETDKVLVREEAGYILVHHLLNGRLLSSYSIEAENRSEVGEAKTTFFRVDGTKLLALINGSQARRLFIVDLEKDFFFRKDVDSEYFVGAELVDAHALIYTSDSVFMFLLH